MQRKAPFEIDIDHPIPGCFFHANQNSVHRNSRVVYQDVYPSRLIDNLFEKSVHVGRGCHVDAVP
jgi:hypothetical protein